MKYLCNIVLLIYSLIFISCYGQNVNIRIERLTIKNGLVIGKIYINNDYLGPTYENEVLRIEKGTYKGVLKYYSQKNFVSSSLGKLATEGDFLLEVGSVQNRDGLLFHTGSKPYHSRGCVLLGSPIKPEGKKAYLPLEHPLRLLRTRFYGSDDPISSHNKKITITLDETKLVTENKFVNTSLLILIDVSGSMEGDKLTQAKKSAKEAVKTALKNKNTEVAILAFSGKCTNSIHTAIGFSTNENFLFGTINSLLAGGGTPLANAIERANEYMARNKSFSSITQMIILLADGDDDCGNLENVLESIANKEIVFRHETIGLGLGDNINAQNQLKSIAKTTKGDFHNSSSTTELSKQFNDALENMKMLEMMGKMSDKKNNNVAPKTNNDKINWDILKD